MEIESSRRWRTGENPYIKMQRALKSRSSKKLSVGAFESDPLIYHENDSHSFKEGETLQFSYPEKSVASCWLRESFYGNRQASQFALRINSKWLQQWITLYLSNISVDLGSSDRQAVNLTISLLPIDWMWCHFVIFLRSTMESSENLKRFRLAAVEAEIQHLIFAEKLDIRCGCLIPVHKNHRTIRKLPWSVDFIYNKDYLRLHQDWLQPLRSACKSVSAASQ